MSSVIGPISPDQIAGLLQELFDVAKSLQLYVLLRFVCGALLVYDYLLTLPDEVDMMWKGKWSLLNAIYYAVRYLPFLDIGLAYVEQFIVHPSTVTCKAIYGTFSILTIIGVDLANCILTLRTYVIWGKDKRVLTALVLALLGSVAGEAYYMTRFLTTLSFVDSPDSTVFPGCFVLQANTNDAWAAYLVLLILESVIFLLTLTKFLQQTRITKSPVLQTIYRDGILFYIFILAISLINIALLRAEQFNSADGVVLVGIHRVLHAILSCRLVLNMRKAAVRRTIVSMPPPHKLVHSPDDSFTSAETGRQEAGSDNSQN